MVERAPGGRGQVDLSRVSWLPTFFGKAAFWWVTLFCWFAFLCFSSSREPLVPKVIDTLGDKLVHVIYFAIGGVALFLGLRIWRPGSGRWVLAGIVVVAMSALGRFDEWHQGFTPGRTGNDLGDWIADSVGGVVAVGIGFLLWRFLEGRRPGREDLASP